MWLPSAWRAAPWMVRLGRERAELYRREVRGWQLLASQVLAHSEARSVGAQAGVAADAVSALLAEASAVQSARRRASLVLESAWLPVLWVPLAGPLLSSEALQGLVRHRLSLVWGSPSQPAVDWQLRLDHRPGAASLMAYALAPDVLGRLSEVAARAGWTWTSLEPAFAWGRSQLRRHAGGWWVCVEQDRALVAQWAGGEWRAFDPAAPLPESGANAAAHWQACVRHESHRRGHVVDAALPLVLDDWRVQAEARGRSGRPMPMARIEKAVTS